MTRTYRLHEVEPAVIVRVADGVGGEIANCLNSFGNQKDNAAFIANALETHATLLAALKAVIEASQEYLPPDGISKDEFINRVIGATDNAQIVWALEQFQADQPT